MTERLLQYIWQFKYFNQNELSTVDGETLIIIHPGKLNSNQGPDFLDARIKVHDTIWVGNIELHLNSSNWLDHNHSNDTNYRNIILHVVWQNDVALELPFPVLELQSKVSTLLLSKYDALMNSRLFIPCENMIHQVDDMLWTSWKERLMIERLQQRATLIEATLEQNNNHWEETFWRLVARNFGVTVNSEAFEKIAVSLPLNIITKHKNQIHQTEALLFGQGGLLEAKFTEDYPNMLKKEYQFYRKKYELKPIQIPLHFLRMRPSNFPTIRLAQLAMLVHESVHLFSVIRDTMLLKDIKKLLTISANDYWHYHYIFDEESVYKKKTLGTQMIDIIIINTIIPILFAYGYRNKEDVYKERALRWLEELTAEKNSITSGYSKLGINNKTAFDSQALLQLKNHYCNQKRCLDCAIGNRLLKTSQTTVK